MLFTMATDVVFNVKETHYPSGSLDGAWGSKLLPKIQPEIGPGYCIFRGMDALACIRRQRFPSQPAQ